MNAIYYVSYPWWARLLQWSAQRLEAVASRAAIYHTPDGQRVYLNRSK